jgi:hypothetical protein
MAFARKLPFAKRWAKQTNFAALPERKDAGTVVGPMLNGPGGLLGTPGMSKRKGRKWGNPTKNKDCTCGVATKEQIAPGITRIRGNLCNVHGRYGPCDASQSGKKPKGKKAGARGRKPAKPKKAAVTPEQRAQDRAKKQAENSSKVLSGLGIAPDGQAALEALRSGKQADAGAIARGGFLKAGLVEQAADGSYRLTGSGRATLNAAKQGDAGRAGDTISGARDRTGARAQRQTAAQQRKQAADERRKKAAEARAKKQSAGGGKQASSGSASSHAADRAQRQAEHEADRKQRQQEHAQDRARRLAEHEQDRARREAERQQQQSSRQPPAPRQAPASRVDTSRPSVIGQRRKRVGGAGMAHGRANVGTLAKSYKAGNPDDYLIVEDRTKPTTWHLQVKRSGTPDHGLMGSAWAALHSGFRGNVYSGPNKAEAISKLRALYKREKMPLPSEKAYQPSPHIQFVAGVEVPGATATVSPVTVMSNTDLQLRQRADRFSRGAAQSTQTYPHAGHAYSHAVVPKNAAAARAAVLIDGIASPLSASIPQSFTVFKSADGSYRWIARSTTAYRDRDGEIITTKALDQDAARMTATKQYGPLRYWHLGNPDPFDIVQPWGPGVDIGQCDYSTVIGRTSIESGTFKSAELGRAFAESAGDYELSPGFFHPPFEPNAAGEYENIRRFERSVVPIKYGRASNLFTGLTVKDHKMDQQTYDARVKAYLTDMHDKGVPPEAAAAQLAQMEQADKSASEQRIAFKSEDADPWAAVATAIKAAMMPVMEKAPPPPMDAGAPDPNAPPEMEAGTDDEAAEETEYIGDMSVSDFETLLTQALQAAIQSFGSDISTRMAAMDEAVKGMGYARTKAENAQQAEITALKARLAELEGNKPAVVNPDDVEAALKGAPAAPPDLTKPQVPNDPARPFAAAAAATFPQLYTQNPDGTFGGWQPFPFAPPQSNS